VITAHLQRVPLTTSPLGDARRRRSRRRSPRSRWLRSERGLPPSEAGCGGPPRGRDDRDDEVTKDDDAAQEVPRPLPAQGDQLREAEATGWLGPDDTLPDDGSPGYPLRGWNGKIILSLLNEVELDLDLVLIVSLSQGKAPVYLALFSATRPWCEATRLSWRIMHARTWLHKRITITIDFPIPFAVDYARP